VYILHYSDAEIHPLFKLSNLVLNEVLLRCLYSLREFGKNFAHRIVIVDNGSTPEGHEDMLQLMKEHGFETECIWNRKEWHPIPVGANAALKDFLDSGEESMAFITSDTKIGPSFLELGFQIINGLDPQSFIEPVVAYPYTIGDPQKYRTPEFWEIARQGKMAVPSDAAKKYWDTNGVPSVLDSWGEIAPVSMDTRLGVPGRRIGLFFARRRAIEMAGFYDEQYLRASEFQYYKQAMEKGCKMETMGYVYLAHLGGLHRTGVGSYHPDQFNSYGPCGDFSFKEGKGNVFAEHLAKKAE